MSGVIKVVLIAVFIGAIALWEGFGDLFFSYPIVNYPPHGGRVLVWGDSLSVGVGASVPEHGYVPILKQRLTLNLANRATDGETTKTALLHSDSDLREVQPDIVMILLGVNDSLGGVAPPETLRNIRQLIDAAHDKKAVVYLIGFQKNPDDALASGFASLAKDTGSLYTADIFGGIENDSSLMYDEVHPNDKGYLKMADKIAPTLEGLVLSGNWDSGANGN